MTAVYVLIVIVAVVAGAVLSRQWTLASIRKMAKQAGMEGALNEVYRQRAAAEKRRALARRRRWNRARLREWAQRKSASAD